MKPDSMSLDPALVLALNEATSRLERGEVVGLPTETVYGLAGRLDRPAALEKIFRVKERPFFDPLIVHVDSIEGAKTLVKDWGPLPQALAEGFWPGPLTLVLAKNDKVPDLVTSGLDSVGVRCPDHSIALELIRRAGPLAAPSANRFGRTSPTSWRHVQTEFGDQVFVIPADESRIGIESSVLKLDGDRLSMLRPGMITTRMIEQSLHEKGLSFQWVESVKASEAPGQMKHHYMPSIPLIWVESDLSPLQIRELLNQRRSELPIEVEGVALQSAPKGQSYVHGAELLLPREASLAARGLYAELRRLGESGADHLFFRFQLEMQGEEWGAILERLTKAASLKLS